jgi:hypothetical protein
MADLFGWMGSLLDRVDPAGGTVEPVGTTTDDGRTTLVSKARYDIDPNG